MQIMERRAVGAVELNLKHRNGRTVVGVSKRFERIDRVSGVGGQNLVGLWGVNRLP